LPPQLVQVPTPRVLPPGNQARGIGSINTSSSGDKSLSGGAAAGIAVGSVLAVGVVCVGVLYFWRRSGRNKPTVPERSPGRDQGDNLSDRTNTTWLRSGIEE
jgi:hypothetical protein